MSNAPSAVAAVGYDVYIATMPRPTLNQLNSVLTAQGLCPVSERMHRHYRKLEKFGKSHYIPINRLDVSTRRNDPESS